MKRALLLAKKSLIKGNMPIAAILVNNNFEIGIGLNFKNCTFLHAEINALKQGLFYSSKKNLNNNTLYITLEPCFLCLSNIFYLKIKNVIFASYYTDIIKKNLKLNYLSNYKITGGILENESKNLMHIFFK